nr:GldG family protein [Feifania hominis]
MTSNKLYEISDETKEYLKTLDTDVTITIVTPENKFNDTLVEIMKKYDSLSDHVTFRSLDIALNPQFAEKFKDETIYSNSIIIESDKRSKILNEYDLFLYITDETNTSGKNALKAEQKLTSSIMYVASDTIPKLAVISGHQEDEAARLESLAEYNSFIVEQVDLTKDELTDDYTMVVIVNPKKDFTPAELDKLDRYFDKGESGAMVFLSPAVPDLPNLEAYLREWGIAVNDDVVLEPRQFIMSQTNVVASFGDSKLFDSLANSTVMVPSSRSIERLFEKNDTHRTETILSSSRDSYSKSAEGDVTTNPGKVAGDPTGPFNLGVRSIKYLTNDQGQSINSAIYVIGSSGFCGADMIDASNLANIDALAIMLNSLKGQADLIYVAPKYYEDTLLSLNQSQVQTYFIAFVIAIPAVFMLIAFVVYHRRRHL